MAETLPAARTHETTPPDDPAARLTYYEAVIDEAVAVAETEQQRAWLALEQIHAEQLWKATHRSFVAYVEERWATNRRQAYRQIAWAREVRALPVSTPVEARRASTPVEPPSIREVDRRHAVPKPAPAAPPQGRRQAVEASATVAERTAPPVAASPTVETPSSSATQLSLFDVPVDDLLDEVVRRLDTSDLADRRKLARRLRSLIATLDAAPARSAPAVDRKKCSCSKGPTKSLTVAGLCTACHGWFR